MKKYIKASIAILFTFLLCINLFIASSSAQNSPQTLVGVTERVSIASDGTQGNSGSYYSSISANGRYVAFSSVSSNLVTGDTNGSNDVFVHDRVTGVTTRVSVASDGTQGNGDSGDYNLSITADGRYVAFISMASNLVVGDTNLCSYPKLPLYNCADVFVHDRVTGETTLVSVASDGTQANNESWHPSISADGRYLAFASVASNLVVGDTNGISDVFVHNQVTGETTRVSVASDGAQAWGPSGEASISVDGRFVAFSSNASNLVVGDTNVSEDIFVKDRVTSETTRLSVASDGSQGDLHSLSPSISADGRYVAFVSWADNLVVGDTNGFEDIFMHDRQTGETTRVSVASNGAHGNLSVWWLSSISADGRFVAFRSDSSNMVVGDTNAVSDVFVHDRVTGETTRVSIASDEVQGTQASGFNGISISANGRYVVFDSLSTNLVLGDTNGKSDIFVRDREGLVVGYSVSGSVSDLGGNPLPGVIISAGYGYSAITDSQGDYSTSGLSSGTYWISASLTDSFFTPFIRTVSMPPNRVGVNFTEGFPAFLPLIGR